MGQQIVSRRAPSGPVSQYVDSNLSGTAPVLAGAGSQATFNVTSTGAAVGDAGFAISPTLAAAGVVLASALCLAANTVTVNCVGTKAFAGGAVADVILVMVRPETA